MNLHLIVQKDGRTVPVLHIKTLEDPVRWGNSLWPWACLSSREGSDPLNLHWLQAGALAGRTRWLLFLCPLVLAAQPAQPPSTRSAQGLADETLTIDEAVQEALEHNLGLIAERYNVTIAQAATITAALRPNPVLSLGGEHLDLLGTGFDLENGAGPSEYIARTDFVIERANKRRRRIETARLGVETAELEVTEAIRQLVLEIQGAFVDAQLARENVALAETNLGNFKQVVAVNERRVRSGDLAEVELLRTRVALLQFQNEIVARRSDLRTALNRLQLLMGRATIRGDLRIAGELRSGPAGFNRESAKRTAADSRPDLAALRRSQARSLAELRLELARGKVDYTVGTEYRRQQGVNGRANSLGVFFSLPLPVYDRNQGEIERARQEQRQVEARIRELELGIAVDVENAFVEHEAAREQLESIESRMLREAREVREIAEYSYSRGEASLIEFLDAQRAFNEVMQAHNAARAAYAQSLYQIDAVAGAGGRP